MALRQSLLYPPYCDLCQFCFLAPSEDEAFRAAEDFSRAIRDAAEAHPNLPVRLILPKVTGVPLVGGKTRVRILMKCRDGREQRELITSLLDSFRKDPRNRAVSVSADMNPVNIL